MLSKSSSSEKKFQFHGFYWRGFPSGPERPFARVFVALPRFGVSRQVDMMVDSGSDITTLQLKDSLLMLEESQFKQLGSLRLIQGIGGAVKFYTEDCAIGFLLQDTRICWVPINIAVADPKSLSTLPSTLGNDVLGFGTTTLNAVRRIVKIELSLPSPLITQS